MLVAGAAVAGCKRRVVCNDDDIAAPGVKDNARHFAVADQRINRILRRLAALKHARRLQCIVRVQRVNESPAQCYHPRRQRRRNQLHYRRQGYHRHLHFRRVVVAVVDEHRHHRRSAAVALGIQHAVAADSRRLAVDDVRDIGNVRRAAARAQSIMIPSRAARCRHRKHRHALVDEITQINIAAHRRPYRLGVHNGKRETARRPVRSRIAAAVVRRFYVYHHRLRRMVNVAAVMQHRL